MFLASGAAVCSLLACGGGGDDEGDGTASLDVHLEDTVGGLVDVEDVRCRREDDRLLANGIVDNQGDNEHYVSIAVRFVDANGVRVALASASVSDLATGESARWEATFYGSSTADAIRCNVSAEVS